MRDGRLVQVGKPEDLYHHPVDLETARFFCDLNEVASTVTAGVASNPLGQFAAPGLPDGPAIVCLRPQAIHLVQSQNIENHGIPARMLSSRFLGEVYMVDLWIGGMEAPLRARLHEKPLAKPKQDVAIRIDRDEVLVFADARA